MKKESIMQKSVKDNEKSRKYTISGFFQENMKHCRKARKIMERSQRMTKKGKKKKLQGNISYLEFSGKDG
jgi:hypothetical protein